MSARPGEVAADRRRLWSLALIAATVAGVAAWAVDEPIHAHFRPPLRRVVLMGYASFRTTPADTVAASVKNAVVANSLLGGLLGLMLGIAGGLTRRSLRPAAVGGGVGLLAGAVLTALASVPAVVGYWWYFGDNALTEELVVPLLAHAAAWAPIGAVGGLALGLGLGGGRAVVARAMLGGLLGALIGSAVYEFAGAALFPLDRTTFPVSISAGSRLLARLSVAIFAAVLAVWARTPGRPGLE